MAVAGIGIYKLMAVDPFMHQDRGGPSEPGLVLIGTF